MTDSYNDYEDRYDDRQMTLAYKKHLISFGIFLGILVFLFFIAFGFSILARKSWQSGLREQVKSALVANGMDGENVGAFEKINSGFSTSCASYALTSSGDVKAHAVIIRMTTFFGPVPAVYTWREDNKRATFICFLNMTDITEEVLNNISKKSQIDYWEKRIPSILSAGYEKKVVNDEK